jgi:hypothetical protein
LRSSPQRRRRSSPRISKRIVRPYVRLRA